MDTVFEPNYQNVVGFFARIIMRDLRLVGGFDVLFGKIKEFVETELFDTAGRPRTTSTCCGTSPRSRRRAPWSRRFKTAINALTVQDRGTTEIRGYDQAEQDAAVPGQGSSLHRAEKIGVQQDRRRQRLRAGMSRLPRRLRGHHLVRQKQPEHAVPHRIPKRRRQHRQLLSRISSSSGREAEIWIIETKGREDLDDPPKWERLQQWCADATAHDGKRSFHALFVRQEEWDAHRPDAPQLAAGFHDCVRGRQVLMASLDQAQPHSAARDVFLSHRATDKDLARKLAADIESECLNGRQLRVWLDEAEIPIGGSLPGHINQGLENSRFVLLLMTPAYFDSPSGWSDAEWHAALNVDPDNRRQRLLPAVGADCPFIPYLLRHLLNVDLRGDNYRDGLEKLVRTVKGEPLPRPVTHRGQLIAPSGKIDAGQLVAERSAFDASPDAVTEILQCNLLPVERLPARIWTAPLNPDVMVRSGKGTPSVPSKTTLIEAARAGQSEAGYENIFTPAFRVISGQVVSFHDLSDPERPDGGNR